jgi:DNA primase
MLFEILKNNISLKTEGHKHCRPGWANMVCPFCSGNPGLHLGLNINDNYFYCWRCGYHSPVKVLTELLKIEKSEAIKIIKKSKFKPKKIKTKSNKITAIGFKLPSNTKPLNEKSKFGSYLKKRKYDPKKVIEEFNLLQTSPFSKLDNISYKHRIIAPIYWNGEMVSFQGRDITEISNLKYLACPKIREKIHHKKILYGNFNREKTIIVEGVTDVWRFGKQYSTATFGIEFTIYQLRLLSKFKKCFVIFDDEPQAQKKAIELVKELNFRGVEAQNIAINGDPGNLDQEEANNLRRVLWKK